MEKKKVLIVDDHPSIRFLLRSLIESHDFTVCGEAADGVAAIEEAKQANPDLILLDLAMPRMNGAEAAPILKKLMPHVPIVLFTMHEDSVGKALAAAMGVDRVIAKPDGMTKLIECMGNVMGLALQQSATVGPLGLPVEGPIEGNHATKSSPTKENSPSE